MADELTLSPYNVAKLQGLGFLSSSVDSDGFWTLQPLPFVIFPNIPIKDNKIPYALNTVEFLQYLGLEAPTAQRIFDELSAITEPTQLKLTTLAKQYVSHKWMTSPYHGAGLNSIVGNLAMSHMGLNAHFIGLVNALWIRSQTDPWEMIRHMNDPAYGLFENYTLLDYVIETIDQLRTKMSVLEKEVNENVQ